MNSICMLSQSSVLLFSDSVFTFNDCKFSKTLMFPYKTSSVTSNFLQNERKSFYNDIVSTSHCQSNVCTSINYFSWTWSKLRSTPKSYLHTYLSRESFIRHLEYWFHHLLLVGRKHKHELIKRAHQYRSTSVDRKAFKVSSSTTRQFRNGTDLVLALASSLARKKIVGRHTTVASRSSWHRFCIIDYQKGEISNVPRLMLLGGYYYTFMKSLVNPSNAHTIIASH